MTSRRVVVTGVGAVSPLGIGVNHFFEALMQGKSSIRFLPEPMREQLSCNVAGWIDWHTQQFPSELKLDFLDRCTQFALIAGREAMADAQLNKDAFDPERMGVYVGTAMGSSGTVAETVTNVNHGERLRPGTVLKAMNSAAAVSLSMDLGLKGPTLTTSTACASSAIAIGEAYRVIKHGYADTMLAGGSEALLNMPTLLAWESLRSMAIPDTQHPEKSCKPFSSNRSGLVLGEGAAFLVLEDFEKATQRGARIYAEIGGFASGSDSMHITHPSVEGQVKAMTSALLDAQIHPDDVDHINAHGTATLAGDRAEIQSIQSVFGESAKRIPITANKSMLGHLMGASGAIEFLTACLSIWHQAIPPTANWTQADAGCDLDFIPNQGRRDVNIHTVLSNSFAFGGTNAVLIAKRVQV